MARVMPQLQNNSKSKSIILIYTLACILGQAAVVILPLFGQFSLSGKLYYEFYHHSTPDAFKENMIKYGVRPLGFCMK
jgi:hypothetical protein